jgi:hypothetical protein
MRRAVLFLLTALMLAGLIAVNAIPALADPTLNESNCVGELVSLRSPELRQGGAQADAVQKQVHNPDNPNQRGEGRSGTVTRFAACGHDQSEENPS